MKIEDEKSFDELTDKEYKYGFVTEIESESLPPGLNEEIVLEISRRKEEPEWLMEWRLKAFRAWEKWRRRSGQRSIFRRLIIRR